MKKFSQQAAANVVPLLARILIFLAFVPTGWHHAMQQTVFTGDQAARLREIGIVAAEKLIGLIRGQSGIPHDTVMPVELKLRASHAPIRSAVAA